MAAWEEGFSIVMIACLGWWLLKKYTGRLNIMKVIFIDLNQKYYENFTKNIPP
jgi:hypothetical protein